MVLYYNAYDSNWCTPACFQGRPEDWGRGGGWVERVEVGEGTGTGASVVPVWS